MCALSPLLPCEDTRKGHKLGEGPGQKPALQDLELALLSLQNCENIHFYCLSHTVHAISLWQQELIQSPDSTHLPLLPPCKVPECQRWVNGQGGAGPCALTDVGWA